jgi:hypothetical protein
MTRISSFVIAAATFAVALQAQCFETNFGAPATRSGGTITTGEGDDFLMDPYAMNISFQVAGVGTSYTTAYFNTNGVIFLSTGVLSPLPTATGYSATPATQLTNLRGTAGQPPRVAPLWRDLNLLAANNGKVWVNNSIPGKFVVTWSNAVQFGSTTPVFTVQAQLLQANNEIIFFYNGTLASSAATIAGVSDGNAIAAVPGVNLNAGPNVVSTALIFEQFAANTIDLQTTFLSIIPSGSGGFAQTSGNCIPATNTSIGVGCYAIAGTGIYENLADAAVASTALQGNAMLLTRGAGGYTGTWVPGGAAALYVAPTGGATSLPANDDGNAVVTLPSPLTVPGGLVAQINVSSNAIITLGAAGNNAGDFSPTGPEFASAAGAAFYSWHDYNPAEVGSGLIKTELVGNFFYVTWDAVENYSNPLAVNPSTMQFRFDLTSGNGDVAIIWQTIDTDTTSTFGSNHLVGWKASGAVTDGGSQVLSTALPFTSAAAVLPLTLTASAAPVVGTTVTFTHDNIPPFVPGVPTYLSALLVDLAEIPGGLDLGIIGAPGCSLYVPTINIAFGPAITAVPTAVATPALFAPVPNFVGVDLFWQAFALMTPGSIGGQNAFGAVTSNAIRSRINSF